MINDPNKHDAVRTLLLRAGYTDAQIEEGIAYAEKEGVSDASDVVALAVSRILYSDEQLAEGARFSLDAGELL